MFFYFFEQECCKCGQVKRVMTLDGTYSGCAAITFRDLEAAKKCQEMMNGRLFDGRSLSASVVDQKSEEQIVVPTYYDTIHSSFNFMIALNVCTVTNLTG